MACACMSAECLLRQLSKHIQTIHSRPAVLTGLQSSGELILEVSTVWKLEAAGHQRRVKSKGVHYVLPVLIMDLQHLRVVAPVV